MPICNKGEIWRVGYSRRTSKKGSKKKSVRVKGKCIKATSQTGEKTTEVVKKRLNEKKRQHKIAREMFGVPKCKNGEIVREGYTRKSKTGKKIFIKPTCVPDVGLLGKSSKTIYIEPDRLSKYGYSNIEQKSASVRHKALKQAMSSGEKQLSVSRRLNALSTLTRNINPKLSQLFKEDSEWIKQTDEYKTQHSK